MRGEAGADCAGGAAAGSACIAPSVHRTQPSGGTGFSTDSSGSETAICGSLVAGAFPGSGPSKIEHHPDDACIGAGGGLPDRDFHWNLVECLEPDCPVIFKSRVRNGKSN